MHLHELFEQAVLLEGVQLKIHAEVQTLYLVEADSIDLSNIATGNSVLPSPTGPVPGRSSIYYTPYGPIIYNRWFSELNKVLRNAAITKNLAKRMKELGIKGEGARRVKLAALTAAKNLDAAIKNPASLAHNIPQFTFGGVPPKVQIKKFNEAYSTELHKELLKFKV
jgi:hypothetical protein